MSWLTESKEYTERMNRVYNKLTESCEKKLEERNWKYTVPWRFAAEFHRLINADCADYDAIRDVLKKIAEFIKSKAGEDDWYYDDLLDDLEYAEFETDDDVNYYINEVYDLLDSYNIWMEPFIGSKMKEGRFPKKEYFYLSTPDTIICDEDGNTLKFDTRKEAEDYIDEYHKGEDVKVLRRRPQFEESKMKESLATMTDDGYLKFRALQSKVDSNILLEEIMNELKTDEAESVVNELCIRYNIDIDEWKKLNFYESKKIRESEDGWNEGILEDCGDVLDRIYDLTYEIKNCIKGAYTGCHI